MHCTSKPEVQCRIRKWGECTVGGSRKCSAEAGNKQVQCRCSPEVQCRIRNGVSALSAEAGSAVQKPETSKCTANVHRKCSAKSGNKQVHCKSWPEVQYRTRKQASALQKLTGSAVQNPEMGKCTERVGRKCSAEPGNKQVHCKCSPEVQCRIRKWASALQKLAGSAVQNQETSLCNAKIGRKCSAKPGNKLVQCKSSPEVQCRTRKQSSAMQKFAGSAVQNQKTSKCTVARRRKDKADERRGRRTRVEEVWSPGHGQNLQQCLRRLRSLLQGHGRYDRAGSL